MITQTISKQRISGAMKKRDQPEWMIEPCVCAFCGPEKKVNRVVTYGRSAGQLANHLRTHIVFDKKCADSVPNYGPMTNSWSTSWVGMEHSLRIVKRTLSPTARIDCA